MGNFAKRGRNIQPNHIVISLSLFAEGRVVFRTFLRCEYSEENILFWLACEDLKKERSPELIEEKVDGRTVRARPLILSITSHSSCSVLI